MNRGRKEKHQLIFGNYFEEIFFNSDTRSIGTELKIAQRDHYFAQHLLCGESIFPGCYSVEFLFQTAKLLRSKLDEPMICQPILSIHSVKFQARITPPNTLCAHVQEESRAENGLVFYRGVVTLQDIEAVSAGFALNYMEIS